MQFEQKNANNLQIFKTYVWMNLCVFVAIKVMQIDLQPS